MKSQHIISRSELNYASINRKRERWEEKYDKVTGKCVILDMCLSIQAVRQMKNVLKPMVEV